MRKLLLVGLIAASLTAGRTVAAQAGISLGAAVGSAIHDGKLDNDALHGLLYLRLGFPLVPYGARGDVIVFDAADAGTEVALIGSAVMSIGIPLVQPYVLAGFGKYGFSDGSSSGVSFGAGIRVGGRRGLFLEGRRHDPINRTMVSVGVAF